ncbi:GntR family transcriptional regulator [Oceanobacillus massiliensis]|uniref:GntR family transcriptional regulator n=1 Tax=Oceanobacillus massiliensis TaxID=1465765 RepID=UPI000288D655|nr:GntR family transcriptional regulator [Oceanobacillus massiliensis]
MDELLHSIVAGNLKSGSKLPSENELSEQYQVPRMTVRNALIKLEERGYIFSKQGKGRYIKQKSIPIQLHLTGKISFTDKMKQLGYNLTTHNIYCEKIGYDEKIYRALAAGQDDAVYQISRMRYINEEPIAIHNSFINESNFPMIKGDGPKIKSMFAYYRKLGYREFSSGKTLLSITFPTIREQQLLSCKSMVPLIVVESECIDSQSEKILEYTKILYRSDKFKYDITMD